MRDVVVSSTETQIAQDIAIGKHSLRADEEVTDGGTDTGPAPHELLLAALGACTSMTLRLYAARKGWLLQHVQVTLTGASASADGKYTITRKIAMGGDLDAEQRKRLLEIANKCPVHKTLSGDIEIQTSEA
ncbi:MAG: OsmC family protein [Vicinamibacterales bacterium]